LAGHDRERQIGRRDTLVTRSGEDMKVWIGVLFLLASVGCSSDPLKGLAPGTGPAISDAALYALIQPDPSWAFYKRSAAPIARTSHPHPQSHALVRYNARAATQLDAAGKVRAGAVFPDSSIIVKELSNGTSVSTYAVMMKVRGSSSAGFDGWIWGELGPTGSVSYSTAGRGAACASCHSSGIDYTRMNDSHP
jgi:hypothetical protein